MFKRKPAFAKPAAITTDQITLVDQGVTAYLNAIQDLKNIDAEELEALTRRGQAIVSEWTSRGLEQWAPPSSQP